MMGERRSIETSAGRLTVHDLGKGPAAVFWPSLFMDERSWERILPAMTRQRRVVIINGPGHGGSGDPGRRYSLRGCASAAAAGSRSARDRGRRRLGG